MAQLVRYLVVVFTLVTLAACGVVPGLGGASEVAKPLNDNRNYRYLELENGLQVLLISDPQADKAAASLDVNVGSRQDPEDYQGLAHFLEHMLFLGTEKYPRAGEYQEFISAHGGGHNAFTSFEHTNYFFDIAADSLEPALDRFAQFFTAPLFNAEFVQREVNAVNSEYRSKIRDDRRRELAVFKAQLNPAHPYRKFSVGNLDTLKSAQPEALREQLLRFYRQYYSADIMTLTVIGRESLAELEAMVRPRFSPVGSHSVALADIDVPLFAEGALPRWVAIEPVQNRRILTVAFPVPDTEPHWRSKPLSYIGNLLGHEGEGSLLSVLKAKGWAESLNAGESLSYQGGAMFGVEINLTEAGKSKVDEIVGLLFANIRMIKAGGVEKWRFDEQSGLARQQFLFRTPPAASEEAVGLSMALQQYPAADVMRGPYAMDQFQPQVIQQYLNALRPDNSLVVLVAPGVETTQEVSRYDVGFDQRPLSAAQLQRWQAALAEPSDNALRLPSANPFIAEDFSLATRTDADAAGNTPRLLGELEGVETWLNTDDLFEVPKGRTYLLLQTPNATGSLSQRVKTRLWLRMVKDQLNELSYPAQLAGLSFSLDSDWRGIEISLGGYNEKQVELLSEVLKGLTNTEWQAARFKRIKAQRLRHFENARKRSPYQQLIDELPRALLLDQPALSAQKNLLKAVTMEQVAEHANTLLQGFAPRLLVDGNFNESDARALAAVVKGVLPAGRPEASRQSLVMLPEATHLRQVKARHDDAAILQYVQSGGSGNAARVAMGLTAQIMSASFYYELRTEKQLGYIVTAGVYPIREVPGIYFLVQSPVAGPEALQQEVEAYIRAWLAGGVSQEEFDKYKASLAKRLAEQPENVWEAADRHWRDLLEHYPDFDSREQLVAALADLSYEQWWQQVSEDFTKPRALVIYAEGKWQGQGMTGEAIESLSEFKSGLPTRQFD